jgi:hypothetical protein
MTLSGIPVTTPIPAPASLSWCERRRERKAACRAQKQERREVWTATKRAGCCRRRFRGCGVGHLAGAAAAAAAGAGGAVAAKGAEVAPSYDAASLLKAAPPLYA